jgi:hypothetical protein
MTTALVDSRYARNTQKSFIALALAIMAAVAIVAAVIAYALSSTSSGGANTPATKVATQQPVSVGAFSQPSPVHRDGCEYTANTKRC